MIHFFCNHLHQSVIGASCNPERGKTLFNIRELYNPMAFYFFAFRKPEESAKYIWFIV